MELTHGVRTNIKDGINAHLQVRADEATKEGNLVAFTPEDWDGFYEPFQGTCTVEQFISMFCDCIEEFNMDSGLSS